jgi:L-cystine transport system ATP-binding protein
MLDGIFQCVLSEVQTMSESNSGGAPIIEVRGVTKSFGRREVLRGIGLAVNQGEVAVLFGPSGSGKTTFLRCINFLERADSGTLRIGDESADLRHASKAQILSLRRKTAMVFQHYDLFLNLSALENVTEGLVTARKVPREEARERAVEALRQVGMEDRLDARPWQLSGGQQQRVGIARALAVNPDVILFDEPTSALDPEKVGEILSLMRAVAKTGVTMIVVTHEMEFAYDVANQAVFIDGGEIIEQGDPRQIFGHPREERTRQFLSRFTSARRPEYFFLEGAGENRKRFSPAPLAGARRRRSPPTPHSGGCAALFLLCARSRRKRKTPRRVHNGTGYPHTGGSF